MWVSGQRQVHVEARDAKSPEAGITGGCEIPTKALRPEFGSSSRAVSA